MEAGLSDAPLVTIVLPLRNRGGVRLRNCLRSLRWQRGVRAADVDILISDFGSDPAFRTDVEDLAREHQARVVFTDARGVWNRSRALNIGIKRATGRYTLCTDVDMVFAPTFVESVLDAQRDHRDRALVLCRCRDLGPDTEGRSIDEGDLTELLEQTTMRPASGLGGCQCAETQWFHRVRGFDQRYTFWGAEDKDLATRAESDGLSLVWVTERTAMLHQWHPTMKYDRPWQVKKNRMRLKLTGWMVRKNWLGWGE